MTRWQVIAPVVAVTVPAVGGSLIPGGGSKVVQHYYELALLPDGVEQKIIDHLLRMKQIRPVEINDPAES